MPLSFLTAKTQTEDIIKDFKMAGNDFIRKPFSMEELIVRMENVLRIQKISGSGDLRNDILEFGKYQINLKRQTLVLNDGERELSYRETELFKFLLQNRSNIIERKKLLQAIWGNDSFFNSRNLDVYITKIRGYLKEDNSIEILTIKGVGYGLVL